MKKTDNNDMKNNKVAITRRLMQCAGVLAGMVCLAGCTLPIKKNVSDVKNTATSSASVTVPVRPVMSAPVSADPRGGALMTLPAGMQRQLETCLFEAKQLAQLGGGAYRQQVAELYRHLQAAKYYASIAGELAGSTTDTITPLYQYKVNDACNGISQSLLVELKKGIMPGRSINP
ncbi:Uncharacterised protein [Serratia quinivorans]|uniref:hypothetical protein n=1 Tax=Serratia TaxID=613 RepID=UPI001E42030A|nr:MULTISPECIES: hypothetical protein [Serratia]CAI1015356.1 Uncharacterised protein [Serratia quinivorans]CAI1056501.1 Uncharacterised protein [Serratia quinivorans]CAI1135440.1 Uncharacterised protein [Serratia quinivorans]CAI1238703.1 Uncharacterised protein [Serratia quinivorans]CAI1855433.1 Uncharacterised protein [Serratia quinivorans]